MADLPSGASQEASEIDAWLASDDDSPALPSMLEPSTPCMPPVESGPAGEALVEATTDVAGPSEPSAAPPVETSASAAGPDRADADSAPSSEPIAAGVPLIEPTAAAVPLIEPTAAVPLIEPTAGGMPPIEQNRVADEPAEVNASPAAPVADRTETPAPVASGSLLQAVSALDRQTAPAPGRADAGRPPAAAEADHMRYVLFAVAGAQYAVRETYVTELDRVPKITLVPNVPVWVRGVTNRRGDILSVIDARTLLGLERTDMQNGRMLVVRLLDDSCSLGMLVDDVQQIASVKFRDIRPPGAALEGPLAPFLTGLFDFDQRTVAVLDLDRLLRSPTIRQFDEPSEATAQN